MTGRAAAGSPAKPTVEDLGIDVTAQTWRRSAGPQGAIEIAFVGITSPPATGPDGGAPDGGPGLGSTVTGSTVTESTVTDSADLDGIGEWVLMRIADDPAGRVLVYDRFEWECFLDGVKKGEFDDGGVTQ